jgi:protein FRG1
MSGQICIEVRERRFLRALDNGSLDIGPRHESGECPDPEEILTCLRIGDSQLALKTGFDKFIGLIANDDRLQAVSDAAGQRELFEPIFQDDHFALVASGNGRFLSVDESLQHVLASSDKAGEAQFMVVRGNVDPDRVRREKQRLAVPEEERGSLGDCEQKYLRKFHGDAQRTTAGQRVIAGGAGELRRAKQDGNLHEALLDRRAKVKSDKFCK